MTGKHENGEGQWPSDTAPERESVWYLVELLLACGSVRTLYLHGRPGVGKTYAAYRKGRIHAGVYCITLTEETPAAELRGFWAPRGGEMAWSDGPFTAAMREGARLVVNELSHASPDVLALLFPVLESLDTARLTLPTGETLCPAPGFHVVCTDNESPDGLPEALRDRFDAVVEIPEPHPEALARLPERLRRAARRTFHLEPDRAISVRAWEAVARLEPELGLERACTAVFGRDRGRLVYEAIALAEGARSAAPRKRKLSA